MAAPVVGTGFVDRVAGYPALMQHSEGLPDDVPVADAIEQQQTAAEQVHDQETLEEAFIEPSDEVPLEAAGQDWQEQRLTADLDPELDEFDRDE